MCFQNLPIEFDEEGHAHLKEGVADPYAVQTRPIDRSQIEELVRRNGHVKDLDIDPVTRVAGALAFHAVVDLDARKVYEANSVASLFRGYEVILKGRDPRDAMFISSRVCGVCGGVHSVASSLAIEMAFGIAPPPMGLALRNIQLALDFMLDNPLHLYILAGPDYSEVVVTRTNPTLWERAQKAETRYEKIHGYHTIADIMRALNPLTGKLYLEGLEMTRIPREAYALLYGKYPHPQTVVPGGLSTTVSLKELNETHNRIIRTIDYGKRGVFIWEDLTDFFYEADPKYKEVGARPKNLIDPGIWDDPFAYDGTYANCVAWGERRWATPGVVIDGALVTTDLQRINMGLEEFVGHSFYEGWENEGVRHRTDPAGNPISPHHPWNKETKPAPNAKRSWKERYTWDTAPRWDRQVMEAGTYARMWMTAAARKLPHTRFLESTGTSLKMAVPKTLLPAMDLEWQIPEVWNAFERNRNRAYHILYAMLVAYENLLIAFDLIKRGETRVATPYVVPQDHRIGVGFWGAGRGWLTHHLEMDKGALINYQIITPSTINASPRDPFGNGGAYEEAITNTPILEEYDRPEDFTGIDIFRALRSFDPCMPCTTHIYSDGGVVTREVNTCGCGIE
ncbi:MAG TPA: nickel-dependent hydrogenase large subunit [Thermomicrobiales bacterium]|nr:nickel-dependent hydrogenase large subunit [Thermomicrobiales bacterium]